MVKSTPNNHSGLPDLGATIENLLAAEVESLVRLKKQQEQTQNLEKAFAAEIGAYNIQLTTIGNLLLLENASIEDFEKARVLNYEALAQVLERRKSLSQQKEQITHLRQQSNEQIELIEAQLGEIRTATIMDPSGARMLKQFGETKNLAAQKLTLLTSLESLFTVRINQLQQVETALAGLSERIEGHMRNRRAVQLLERNPHFIDSLAPDHIREQIRLLGTYLQNLLIPAQWHYNWQVLTREGWSPLVSALTLYLILLILMLRLERLCRQWATSPFWREHPWHHLAITLFRRSLLLGGTILFIYGARASRLLKPDQEWIHDLMTLLVVVLFTRWAYIFRKHTLTFPASQNLTPLHNPLQMLIHTTRLFGVGYVLLSAGLAYGNGLALLLRLIYEGSLVAWGFVFWLKLKRVVTHDKSRSTVGRWLKPVVGILVFTVPGLAAVLELAGFGGLALFWLTSWGLTAGILIWAVVILQMLRERSAAYRRTLANAESEPPRVALPVMWMALSLGWLVWATGLVILTIMAWGGKHTVLSKLLTWLNHPLHIGTIELSLMGVFNALLVLFITHLIVKFWNHLLRTKILQRSGMESGLQDSIIGISFYILWIVGILVALQAFGLNTTTIAVAFGALGIGLGFGLQNIFNNFVSGIILLFERPIQVGDAVEINGIWGEIRKINIRSTVVQTYDNASLIIPNSQFISSQVTNWSFKDKRLRRKLTIGVEYGSDVEQVRQILLEITETIDSVLKYPKPDVIFKDHGDNALIFMLRYWTTIDFYYPSETDIRFAIERRFREAGIVIAFPQRDIHIRSLPGEMMQAMANGLKKA